LMEGAPYKIDHAQVEALRVVDADFQWEETQADEGAVGGGKRGGKNKGKAKAAAAAITHESDKEKDGEGPANLAPFALRNINMSITRGSIVAIAGRVG
jgi:ATP-binding cassette subfamily C (CFTR/MRP) protein 1